MERNPCFILITKLDGPKNNIYSYFSSSRETIDKLEVVIIASDGLHNTEWKKIVPILDINDNAPRFLTPEFSFDIFENVERGAFVGKIEAEDSDDNEKITYSFISDWGLDTFSIGKFNYFGGCRLYNLSISQVINHVTCYKFKCSHWLKYSLQSE